LDKSKLMAAPPQWKSGQLFRGIGKGVVLGGEV
jgi:hypothetical protein